MTSTVITYRRFLFFKVEASFGANFSCQRPFFIFNNILLYLTKLFDKPTKGIIVTIMPINEQAESLSSMQTTGKM